MQAQRSYFRWCLLLAWMGLAAGFARAADDGARATQITPATVANRAGCGGCHAADRKVLGPSYQDIAARYSGDADAAAALAARLRRGSRGVWGPVPMQSVTTLDLNDAELAAVVAWILGQ